eukprot:CAMPEP_0196667730 /NCGR_PEP_ID=MMETSP1086-20130531/65242_1 /TAXON_ID=77921 /ORGANISM="Cyanoptyche  gloeocystis , Strain SAG4.97" /LENGTH=506 /DNA_ID=CAMNT_0042005085 /DNA_START=1 /DNA_END=1521 /DNA_ORIENTATION=-
MPSNYVGLRVQFQSSTTQATQSSLLAPNSILPNLATSLDADVLVKSMSHVVREQITTQRITGFSSDITPYAMDRDLQAQLHGHILTLLQPRPMLKGKPDDKIRYQKFPLSAETLDEICRKMLEIVQAEPMLTHVGLPVRIFGDIHGQYDDLLQFFHATGYPLDFLPNGDILNKNYLFLGDYVDRGINSLEVVSLLFALKIKYPQRVVLIRGNHEDPSVNRMYGFLSECVERLGEDAGTRIWEIVNNVFNHMPVACMVADGILCVHGGIGRIKSLWNVRHLPKGETFFDMREDDRPAVQLHAQVLGDLLWSDPAPSDTYEGFTRNPRGASVLFGPDVVKKFLDDNGVQIVVRAHEVTKDGVEWSAEGRVVTVFSATNYCGKEGNNGAVLEVSSAGEFGPDGRKIALLQAKVLSAPHPSDVTASCWVEPKLPRTPDSNLPTWEPPAREGGELPREDNQGKQSPTRSSSAARSASSGLRRALSILRRDPTPIRGGRQTEISDEYVYDCP